MKRREKELLQGRRKGGISAKTRGEIDLMRESGRHVAEILLELRALVRPGLSTGELERHARSQIEKRGLTSSFLDYAPMGLPPYPAVLCVSVNEEIVHGIPGARVLREGDIVGIDFGIEREGFHGDSAVTVPVGEIPEERQRLLDVTLDSLHRGAEQMRPGRRLSDIGHAVQSRVEPEGFSVIRDFAGHGIGRRMHEDPWVPNYGRPGTGPRLQPGWVFAIEPMVAVGRPEVRILEDEWTAVTADGSLSAHFEHTVLITEDGPEILTWTPGSH